MRWSVVLLAVASGAHIALWRVLCDPYYLSAGVGLAGLAVVHFVADLVAAARASRS